MIRKRILFPISIIYLLSISIISYMDLMDSQKNQDIIRKRVTILLNLDEFEKYKDKIEVDYHFLLLSGNRNKSSVLKNDSNKVNQYLGFLIKNKYLSASEKAQIDSLNILQNKRAQFLRNYYMRSSKTQLPFNIFSVYSRQKILRNMIDELTLTLNQEIETSLHQYSQVNIDNINHLVNFYMLFVLFGFSITITFYFLQNKYVSNLRKSTHLLQKSEEKFSKAFISGPDGLIITRLSDGKIVEINEVMLKALNYKKEEIINKTTEGLRLWGNNEERKIIIEKLIRNKEVRGFDTLWLSKDKKYIPGRVSAKVIEIEGELHAISIVQDLTQLKENEKEIKKLNRIYAFTSAINQLIVKEKNNERLIKSILNIAENTGGFNYACIGLKDIDKGTIDKFNNRLECSMDENGQNGCLVNNINLMHKYLKKSNGPVIVNDLNPYLISSLKLNPTVASNINSLAIFPIKLESSAFSIMVLGSIEKGFFNQREINLLSELSNDISYAIDNNFREELKEKIEFENQRLISLVHNTNDFIAVFSLDDKTLFLNNAGKRLVGIDADANISDYAVKEFYTPESWLARKEKELPSLRQNGFWKGESSLRHFKTNQPIPITKNTFYVKDLGTGKILGIASIGRDMTIRKKYEAELIAAKNKAEEMNKIKSNFLANMSHELRTPMIGILGFSDVLKDELKDEEHLAMLEQIYSGASRLLSTLNLILDLSRIEARSIEINPKINNIAKIVIDTVKLFEGYARKNNLKLKAIINGNDIFSLVDEQLLNQIINNLLNNALKFTKEGEVIVTVSKEIFEEKLWSVIKVSDTGIGIPAKSISLIFEEFRQASEGLNRNYEGTGIGLTITKRIVEMMGGIISVQSIEGKGSTFTVRFLYTDLVNGIDNMTVKNKIVKSNDSLSVNNSLPKVLLVENDKTTINFVNYSLRKVCSLDIADNGPKAIEMTKENDYAVILMDIGLGLDMNGIQATKEIRKIKGYETTPIVAMTAYAMDGDKENFLSKGMTHYLSKPFSTKDIFNLVNEIISNQQVDV